MELIEAEDIKKSWQENTEELYKKDLHDPHNLNGVIERLLLNHAKAPGFLAPGGEEFNPGPEMRLDRSELLCNKFY